MQEAIISSQWLNILNEAAATNSAPSGAAAGVKVPLNRKGKNVLVRFRHTATGARTFTVALWGYILGEVTAAGAAIASTAGWADLEETITLASTATDGSFVRVFEALTGMDRVYAEITAVTGTSAKVSVALGLTEE